MQKRSEDMTTRKVKDLEQRIDILELIGQIYPQGKIESVGTDTYRVNPCPVCGSKDHFTIYPETNSYHSFSGCTGGGSIYQLLQDVLNLTEDESYKMLQELAGEESQEMKRDTVKNKKSAAPEAGQQPSTTPHAVDFTSLIHEYNNNIKSEDLQHYAARGITPETVDKFKLGIDNGYLTIPTFRDGKCYYYTQRNIDENSDIKYKNLKGVDVDYFNRDYLSNSEENPVIVIVEGIFDALSLEQAGIKAIALNGANQINKFLKLAEETGYSGLLVGAGDRDAAGQQFNQNFKVCCRIPEQFKDVNEWAVNEPESFKKDIQRQLKAIASTEHAEAAETATEAAIEPTKAEEQQGAKTKIYNAKTYFERQFFIDSDKFKSYEHYSTGFKQLDENLGGLTPSLYLLGGASSIGKTTLTHQIADNLARGGNHVLFFTLEQSALELVSKSLARITYQNNKNEAISSGIIRRGEKQETPALNKALSQFLEFADKMNIVESNLDTTAEEIRAITDEFIETNNVKPIVFIDYLQIIQEPRKRGYDTRRAIDFTVSELARMSRDLGIMVFVLSAFNRASYLEPVSFESFKESGNIEYTAVVSLGLELAAIDQAVEELDKVTPKTKAEAKKVMDKAKEKTIRKMRLVCLKNRLDKPTFKLEFEYNAVYDTFKEIETEKAELQE